ncbi:MAG: T9SS type A sorting domain-containing protein [bacterium]
MKKVILFVLIFVLANQFAFSWVKGGLGSDYMIFNPGNDKDLVISAVIDGQASIFYLDLVNSKTTKITSIYEHVAAISEKNSMLITRGMGFKLYNYKTGENILTINEAGEDADPTSSTFLFCIDSTGKYFYSWNRANLTLRTYDIYEKKLIDTYAFNFNPVNIFQSVLLPGKNSLCMINNNGVAQFYSLSGNHYSNLPSMNLSASGKAVTVFENDNYFTYATGANTICIQKIDPNVESEILTLDNKCDEYSFTNGMKYCYYNYDYSCAVYDVEKKQDRPIQNFPYGAIQIFFRDSTLSKSLIGYTVSYPMSSFLTTKAEVNILFLYDVENQKVRSSVPPAFAGSVNNMIINPDGSLVYANSGGGGSVYNLLLPFGALVRNQDSTCLRYLHPKGKSFTFTSDSKYMVSADSNSIYFTNTNSDQIEKTVVNTNVSQRKVLFSSDDTKMYNIYAYGIDVYDYPAMNLVKSVQYENGETLNVIDAKNFNNVTTILTDDMICWYAKDADALTYSAIPRISTKLKAIELSPKGDYALLYSRHASPDCKDTFLVMNVYSKKVEYKFTHQGFSYPFEIHFFGSHKRLTFSYYDPDSPTFPDFLNGINLETGVEKELIGMHRAFMHPTENGYFSAQEPYYYYTGLPSELIVGVNDNQAKESSFEISPNPAGDFITIDLGAINPMLKHGVDEYHAIQIYNTLGEIVISESIHQMTASHRMNIESLPKGMYFVRVGSEIGKFVKL